MQAWDEALRNFLSLPPTRESITEFASVIPFDSLCKTLITTDVAIPLREDLSTALRRCLQVQSVYASYCLRPLTLSILHFEGKASDEEEQVAEHFFVFLEELAHVTEGDVNRCLGAALGPMLQMVSGLCLAENSTSVKSVAKRLLEAVLLPLLDCDQVGVAEMARRSIECAIDGRMLHVIPQAKDLDPRLLPVEKQDRFDSSIMKWQGQKLQPSEKDSLCRWLEESHLIQALKQRLLAKAKLTAGKNCAPLDVVRVRAASLLILLIEACPTFEIQARKDGWVGTIVSTLYQTDDVLLRMSAAELVITEILQSAAAIDHLWENNLCDIFLTDLKSAEIDSSLRWGLVRLLSNVAERVPQSREDILMKDNTLVKTLASQFDTVEDFTHRPNALSAIGSVASGLNTIGIQALYKDFPEWTLEYERVLKAGTEAEILAALTGVIRIAGGLPDTEAHKSVRDQRGLKALEDGLALIIITDTLRKPFAATRELCFKALTALLMLGVLTPLREIIAKRDLQKSIFAPVYDDPPTVCYAKHSFIQKALAMYGDWLKTNCTDTTLLDAMNFFSAGGPYSSPPQYKDETVDVEEQIA